ncbi:MAG: hypothetical protein ACLUD0_08940 [Eubacterium ramulus]
MRRRLCPYNLIKIKSGELVNQGRHIRIPVNSYEEVTIQNGAQGMYRSDLIVMRYKKDTSAQVESAELVVIKGKASSSIQASVPRYVSGNILSGATQDDFPVVQGITERSDDYKRDEAVFRVTDNRDVVETDGRCRKDQYRKVINRISM